MLAATEWVSASLVGPSPQAVDLIAAVNGGLVRLGDPWEVTRRGRVLIERGGSGDGGSLPRELLGDTRSPGSTLDGCQRAPLASARG